MWEHVELREVRVFLVLCDELHFGRTADRMHLSQTRVSQLVRLLERKLGAQLFERTSRRVALTPAGRTQLGAKTSRWDRYAAAVAKILHADAGG